MVIAYHLIWTAYGWWLPNDPRGSTSRTIKSDVIADLGELHYGRKRVQPSGRTVREFRERAAQVLHYPLLPFDECDRNTISSAFAQVVKRESYTCYACAIMPDQVHILIRKHKHKAEEMIDHLRFESRSWLVQSGSRGSDHPVWTDGHGWIVFLDHPDEIRRTIPYIEQNPVKIALPKQAWSFAKPYDGWPLHKKL